MIFCMKKEMGMQEQRENALTEQLKETIRTNTYPISMDSNINFLVELAIEASSFQQWLEAWADGKPLFHLDWEQTTKIPVSHLGRTS
jgi:hypothetical protein